MFMNVLHDEMPPEITLDHLVRERFIGVPQGAVGDTGPLWYQVKDVLACLYTFWAVEIRAVMKMF